MSHLSSEKEGTAARRERQAWINAEYIAEEVFQRRRAPAQTLELLQECLMKISEGQNLRPIPKGVHVR